MENATRWHLLPKGMKTIAYSELGVQGMQAAPHSFSNSDSNGNGNSKNYKYRYVCNFAMRFARMQPRILTSIHTRVQTQYRPKLTANISTQTPSHNPLSKKHIIVLATSLDAVSIPTHTWVDAKNMHMYMYVHVQKYLLLLLLSF